MQRAKPQSRKVHRFPGLTKATPTLLASLAIFLFAHCNMLWSGCLRCPDDKPNCANESANDARTPDGELGMLLDLTGSPADLTMAGVDLSSPPGDMAVKTVLCPSLQLSWKNPDPQGFAIKGMWGSDKSNIWAITESATFLMYDGTKWNNIPEIYSPTVITALSGSAADNIWAVGHNQTILRYDGIKWQDAPKGMLANLYGVWVSDRDVWTAGSDGAFMHYKKGTDWSLVLDLTMGVRDMAPITIRGVWASSDADVWFVGDGGRIFHYTVGPLPQEIPSPTMKDLHGIWGTAKNNIWAVGADGTIIKYDGSAWTTETSGTSEALHAIHGADAASVIAVGSRNTILRRNGSTWTSDVTPMVENIDYYAAWVGDTGGSSWAGGQYGRILYKPSKAVQWSTLLRSNGNWWGLSTISMQPTGDLWIGSIMAPLYRFTSAGMLTKPLKGGMEINAVNGLWGVPKDKVLVSMISARKLAVCTPAADCQDHGASLPVIFEARKVWGTSETNLWIAEDTKLSHWDGMSWDTSFTAAKPISAIWGLSSMDVWAAGAAGYLAHWDGTNWTQTPSGVMSELTALWGTSTSDVWAVGEFGTAVHWNGSKWIKSNAGLNTKLTSISGSNESDVWVAGYGLFRWDGTQWSTVLRAPNSPWMQVWVESQCNAWVVGEGGSILNIH